MACVLRVREGAQQFIVGVEIARKDDADIWEWEVRKPNPEASPFFTVSVWGNVDMDNKGFGFDENSLERDAVNWGFGFWKSPILLCEVIC